MHSFLNTKLNFINMTCNCSCVILQMQQYQRTACRILQEKWVVFQYQVCRLIREDGGLGEVYKEWEDLLAVSVSLVFFFFCFQLSISACVMWDYNDMVNMYYSLFYMYVQENIFTHTNEHLYKLLHVHCWKLQTTAV